MYDTSHEILSKDEEYELAVKMKAGCQRSKDLLIKHNVRLVYKIAGKFITPVPFEELVQEGMIGLIKSLEKFEPERDSRSAPTPPTTSAGRSCGRWISNRITATKSNTRTGRTQNHSSGTMATMS